MHIRTRYKCYTVHTQAHRTHTQWAQTCTPFTFMHTETHMHTHTANTTLHTHACQTHSCPLHTVLLFGLPLPFPSRPPAPSPAPFSFSNSSPLAVQRSVPHLPRLIVHCGWNVHTVFCASSLPFFCFLGWRSWVRNGQLIKRCKIPANDKNKVVKMLNTWWSLDPGSLGMDTDRF